jgi:hypothetical protein
MVDKFTARSPMQSLSFGGFLGVGEKYHPLPWSALTYDVNKGGYMINMDKATLQDAPTYERDEDPWLDPTFGRRVSEYYDLP